MISVTFRKLVSYPSKQTAESDRRSPFKASWSNTLDLLDKELFHLDAQDIFVEICASNKSELRADGWPPSDIRVTSPHVAIFFGSKHGPLCYRCDACLHWQHNLRAIALTLERLRMAELYGVIKAAEQYRGFRQLGSGLEMPPPEMTVAEAAVFLRQWGSASTDEMMRSMVAFKDAYRAAASALHPDRNPAKGDWNPAKGDWNKLQQAYEALATHHKCK